jgi:hypothetical protein
VFYDGYLTFPTSACFGFRWPPTLATQSGLAGHNAWHHTLLASGENDFDPNDNTFDIRHRRQAVTMPVRNRPAAVAFNTMDPI